MKSVTKWTKSLRMWKINLYLLLTCLLIISLIPVSSLQSCANNKVEITCIDIENIHNKSSYLLRCKAGRPFTSTSPNSTVSSVVYRNGSDVPNLDIIGALEISNAAALRFIPTGIKRKFPNLYELAIKYCSLQAVHKSDLKELGSSLVILSLDANRLTAIDAHLFEFNTNLEKISLSFNPIRHINPAFFTNLKNLQNISSIDLRYLSCMNQQFDSSTDHEIELFQWDNLRCFDGTAISDTQCLQCMSNENLCLNAKIESATTEITDNDWEIAMLFSLRFDFFDDSVETIINHNEVLEKKVDSLDAQINTLSQELNERIDSLEAKLDRIIEMMENSDDK